MSASFGAGPGIKKSPTLLGIVKVATASRSLSTLLLDCKEIVRRLVPLLSLNDTLCLNKAPDCTPLSLTR